MKLMSEGFYYKSWEKYPSQQLLKEILTRRSYYTTAKLHNKNKSRANVNNTAGSQITSSSIEPKLWGDHTKDDIHHKIDVIYEKIAFWRRNLFKLPSGAAGKKFISETTKWIEFWNQDVNEYKDIALKVLMVMPALLLQKPSFKSTAKQHSQCLSRRLTTMGTG